jgi:predicted metalloprotease with PDZ domain
MKQYLFAFWAIGFSLVASAQWPSAPIQRSNEYQVFIDITSYADDQLTVSIVPPLIESDTAFFIMPKVVPGTYDISDFGRFVNDFEAINSSGEPLPIDRIDNNRWQIARANELYTIRYRIDDSFDHPVASLEIFRPGGTSFEDEAYLFNLFGMVGYIEQAKNVHFELQVKRPTNLYGATALDRLEGEEMVDRFQADTYFDLHDRPILYAKADTASTMLNETEVITAVYSKSGAFSAKEALESSADVLAAIGKYLGGSLPTDRYVILIYADAPDPSIMGYGALEHQTSTVLYLPEFDASLMGEEVRDIVAHEFLHIVTPLAIHSEYINDYDFYNPEMSKHLWLYEGITEYTSHLVQVRDGLISVEDFVDIMEGKMEGADAYNSDLPMTIVSEHVLEIFEDQYQNVYQKGALVGMALDLHMRINSDGKLGLIDIMNDLGQHFGPDTFFVDDELFDLISDRWGMGLQEFFARYVEGAQSLPFAELLGEVGILYEESRMLDQIGFGDLPLAYDPDQEKLFIYEAASLSPMGEELGIQEGDRLLELNGQPINVENARDIFSDFYANTQEGDKVKMVVLRQNEDGEWEDEKLKCKATSYPVEYRHLVRIDTSPTTRQAEIRSAWLNQ